MSELSIPPTVPLRERLPAYAAHLHKLDTRRTLWEAKRDKVIANKIRHELGLIAIRSIQAKPIDPELTILSYEPSGRHGSIRAERLAWDLGVENDVESTDEYIPHLYLAQYGRRFYAGDPGRAFPYSPAPSFDLLDETFHAYYRCSAL